MRCEVDMVRCEVIIYHDYAILLEILFNALSLYDVCQLGWRNVLPTPEEILEDRLWEWKEHLMCSIAYTSMAATERGQRAKFEGEHGIGVKAHVLCILDQTCQ